ncbi:MAG: bifunctional UDP-N-acetylglucosamine diphosphorylase/glucosamine-1-phosphate N-acetyltransferase GlmU [Anaerolineae bacterium]|nr:bifunctional UDP-N-acetylglucosamine diphosphorylase/glucosamine-1-phosphate N-acetyltransferase GlmU [Anaerolineae bacterium]
MKSDLAKVLHPVGGKPMVMRAVDTAHALNVGRTVVVVGRDGDAVRALLGDGAESVEQGELLGTGHAVLQAESALRDQVEWVVVFYADMPLLRAETIARVLDAAQANPGPMAMLTLRVPDPRGFGRVVRGPDGGVLAIVEERECTPDQLAIRELNPGVYAYRAAWLWDNLKAVRPKSKGEYYLTDLVEIAAAQGHGVPGIEADDAEELIGVNTRVHLAEAETALRRRTNAHWMLEGVTIQDPATTYIGESVNLAQDVTILPNTHLEGQTSIGPHSILGPNTTVRASRIGAHCLINNSVIEESTVEDHVKIGPYCHLRPKAHLCEGAHLGNFAEVKNSRLGKKTRMHHFSYVGDAEVGDDVNIGAGTITVNYDGKNKHKTTIGDHAFIGSDSLLIAPVTVQHDARTAAGAVVTKDVPTGKIAIGVPARMRDIRRPEPDDKG